MSTKDRPDPEKVKHLIEKHTPEQLAVAYLRATRRARQAELSCDLISDLLETESAIKSSDGEAAIKKLEGAMKRLKTAAQTGETK